MDKKELRRFIRAEKKRHDEAELARLSDRITQALLRHPRVLSAQTILLYHALPDEVDTRGLLSVLEAEGKTLLLPKVISDTEMELHRYEGEKSLRRDVSFGIMEPDNAPFTDLSSIDLMIIPGMAFDNSGHRLGRGKGYYDRFLSRMDSSIYKIGVCFPFQFVASVPSDDFDVEVDEVVSPTLPSPGGGLKIHTGSLE